jgi:hypothetical protein
MSEPSVHTAPSVAKRLYLAVWLALIGLTVAAFCDTVKDAREYGGTDLRARVVGARELLLKKDPYFTPAQTDQIETLQDPDRYANDATRCTYSPTLLYLYAPLAHLPYKTQRLIWFGIEWAALAGSILLLRATLRGRLLKDVFTALALIFFADGAFWRLHVERGQYYIFIVFLMSLTAYLSLRKRKTDDGDEIRHDQLWYGIPLGIAAAIRLTPLAILLPLWAAGFKRTAIGAAVIAMACVGATMHFGGVTLWKDYFRNANFQSKLILDRDFAATQRAALPPLPATAEGVTFQRVLDAPIWNITFATQILGPFSQRMRWIPNVQYWNTLSKCAAALVCLLFTTALWFRPTVKPPEALAAAFLCGLLVDFFVPIRYSYADISFLIPIGLLMPWMLRNNYGYICFAVVLLALALGHSFLPLWMVVTPIIRPMTITAALLVFLILRFLAVRLVHADRTLHAELPPRSDLIDQAAPVPAPVAETVVSVSIPSANSNAPISILGTAADVPPARRDQIARRRAFMASALGPPAPKPQGDEPGDESSPTSSLDSST